MRRLTEFERRVYAAAAGAPAPFCMVQRWPWWWRGFRGFALGVAVFVKDDRDIGLVCHEVAHVAQFRAHPLSFWLRYLFALAATGYHRNPFEREAQRIAVRARSLALADDGRGRA